MYQHKYTGSRFGTRAEKSCAPLLIKTKCQVWPHLRCGHLFSGTEVGTQRDSFCNLLQFVRSVTELKNSCLIKAKDALVAGWGWQRCREGYEAQDPELKLKTLLIRG